MPRRLPPWPIGHVLVQVEDATSPLGWSLSTIPVEQYLVDAMEDEHPYVRALLAGDAGPLNDYLKRHDDRVRVVIQRKDRAHGAWQEPRAEPDPATGPGGADLGFADEPVGPHEAADGEAFATGALIAAHTRGNPSPASTARLRPVEAGPGSQEDRPQDGSG